MPTIRLCNVCSKETKFAKQQYYMSYALTLCDECIGSRGDFIYLPQKESRGIGSRRQIKVFLSCKNKRYYHEDDLLFTCTDRNRVSGYINIKSPGKIKQYEQKLNIFETIIDQVCINLRKYDLTFEPKNTRIWKGRFSQQINDLIKKRLFYHSLDDLRDITYWVDLLSDDILRYTRKEYIIESLRKESFNGVDKYKIKNDGNIINLKFVKPLCDKYMETGDKDIIDQILELFKQIKGKIDECNKIKDDLSKFGIKFGFDIDFK